MKVPDGLPALPSDSSKPPIAQAIYRMQHPGAAYETAVPLEWRSAFAEAIDEAKQRAQQTVLHERRFVLKKRYRLLSEAEIQEYYSLSPHVVPTQWRLDPRVERKYRGSGGISYLALPSYDGARRLALLWVDSDGGGCANRQWYFFHAQRRRMVAPGLENHGYGGVRVRRKHCPLYALETYVVLEWMTNLPTAF
jgi:hypothetical protein